MITPSIRNEDSIMKIYIFTGNLWAANDSEAGDGKRAIHMWSKK